MKLTDLYTVDKHDAGAEVQILDGEGNKTPLKIRVRGMDSAVFRAATKRQQKLYVEAMREDREYDSEIGVIDGLVDATMGWSGTDEKFTPELCKELYEKAPYVKDQIDRFIGDRANFTKAKRKK